MDFQVIDTFARMRYTGDYEGLREVLKHQVMRQGFDQLVARACVQDDKVVKDHIANGGRWVVLAKSMLVGHDRMLRAGVKGADLKFGSKHIIIVPGLSDDSRLWTLGRHGLWKILVHASVRAPITQQDLISAGGGHWKWMMGERITDILLRSASRGIEIIVENWT